MGNHSDNEKFYSRLQKLAGISKQPVNESKNNGVSTLVSYMRSDNGDAYGIVKENHNYFIKRSNKSGDLNLSDFGFIGGVENKHSYQYKSLSEAEKQCNLVVKSINEAFSLGGVYNKLNESKKDTPSLEVKEDIGSFLKNRITEGKKSLAESSEKKFKSTFNKSEDEIVKSSSLMNENATMAIQKALGKLDESDHVTADSDIKDADRVDNETKVEKGQSAALNQEDNQKKADKNNASGGKDHLSKEGGKNSISVNQSDEVLKEGEDLITADSELESEDSLANHTGHKESAQAPINDENAKSEAEKATATGGEVTPEVTSGEEDIVAEGEVTGDPFDDSVKKHGKDEVTADSDIVDADRVDDSKDVEKPDSYDSHYNPEKAHKEEKGEELKPKESKKDIVAEGKEEQPESDPFDDKEDAGDEKGDIVAEEDLSTADSEQGESIANEDDGNIDYSGNEKLQDGTSFEMDDNAIAEDEDGSAEIDAAAQAMNDLDIEAPAEETPVEPAPAEEPEAEAPAEEPAESPEPEVAPEEGGEEEAPAEEPEAEETPAEEPASEEDESDAAKNISKYVGKIGHEAQSEDHTPEEVKGWINQITASFKSEIADMPVEDRKAIADKILKMDSGEEGDSKSLASDMPKDAEAAIDNEIEDLEQKEESAMSEGESCNECGTFESYMESRGYSKDDIHECSPMEMGNLVSGYANAYKKGDNDGDHKTIAMYVSPEVAEELKGYGHSDYVEELDPFIKQIGEGGVKFGAHEPMVDPAMTEDEEKEATAYAEKFEKELAKTGKQLTDMTDDEKKAFFGRMDKIHKAKNEGEEMNETGDMDSLAKGVVDKGQGNMLKRALAALQNIKNPDSDTKALIKSYQKALGLPAGMKEGSEEQPESDPFDDKEESGDEKGDIVAEEPKLGAGAEVMGAGVLKPDGAEMEVEEVSESEKKIRNYVRKKLEELAGKRKPSLQEGEKSEKIKQLDKMIEEQWNLYGETIKTQLK